MLQEAGAIRVAIYIANRLTETSGKPVHLSFQFGFRCPLINFIVLATMDVLGAGIANHIFSLVLDTTAINISQAAPELSLL